MYGIIEMRLLWKTQVWQSKNTQYLGVFGFRKRLKLWVVGYVFSMLCDNYSSSVAVSGFCYFVNFLVGHCEQYFFPEPWDQWRSDPSLYKRMVML
jgi:hypothetical protein